MDDGTQNCADPFLTRAADMLKAVKAIAGADGLSEDELMRLRLQMDALEVPAEVREEVEAFDPTGVSLEQLLATFPKGGFEARNLLVAAIGVAVVDGYSPEERAVTQQVAEILGIPSGYVLALERSSKLGWSLEQIGDDYISDQWASLQQALLKVDCS